MRHKQRHGFALLHPGAAHRLTATPETTAALLKDILDERRGKGGEGGSGGSSLENQQ